MFHKQTMIGRGQMGYYAVEDLVPKDHLLRQIDQYVDFEFIYDLVKDKYSPNHGRPSLDPVLLIKIPIIQYLFGIQSMRQTIKELEVNVAYRWFLGLDFQDRVPHFTTFGKNYSRRFKDTTLFEEIFYEVLNQAFEADLVEPKLIYVDGTHIKAHANRHQCENQEVAVEALIYQESLEKEIDEVRSKAKKKPFKKSKEQKVKNSKRSTTDPDSGWFHKGEHKEVFAYCAQVACDTNGWVLGYTADRGNVHDSRAFFDLYAKLTKKFPKIDTIVADAGYKTPAIAKRLLDDGRTGLFPYTRPRGKKDLFRKREFSYDYQKNSFTCPNGKALTYRTTRRDGYQEYRTSKANCQTCPFLQNCTTSQTQCKTVFRHIWQLYLDKIEQNRLTTWGKTTYRRRKETIERLFGTAKEHHNLRYTHENGRDKLQMKLGLTFACLNMKKLAKMMKNRDRRASYYGAFQLILLNNISKRHISSRNMPFVCSLKLSVDSFFIYFSASYKLACRTRKSK